MKMESLQKIFKDIPFSKMQKLAYNFNEKVYFKNQYVFKENQRKPYQIYLIRSGEVQIIKNEAKKKNNCIELIEKDKGIDILQMHYENKNTQK